MKQILSILLAAIVFTSCSSSRKSQKSELGRLNLIGQYEVAYNKEFKGTTIGGLSGIDYNAKTGEYYMISDDRSDINPVRYYTAKIYFQQKGLDSIVFTDVNYLKRKDGSLFPSFKKNEVEAADPEALRYNPKTDQMVWSSEGERQVTKDKRILTNPFVAITSKEGAYIDTFILPEQFRMQATENGPRRNGVFEGLSFADNYKTLYVSLEEPLYQDGPRADIHDTTAWTRIIKFDVASKKPVAQYAYHLEPIAYAPKPADGFKVNGISDIMTVNDHSLLSIERSYSVGRVNSSIKVFEVELRGAQDINAIHGLSNLKDIKPVKKKLLIDMDSLGILIDNIEGVTFGPTLPNGHRTLVFVSDNNFNEQQHTQFFVYEIL
ncbi:MAG: esterase-like activity of phytase family protein [Filimonas sp.]|nr:esterase-like activity of phytase family protein [Filimonas sp.]